MKYLAINPGGTSTKIAVYEDHSPLFEESIPHWAEDLKDFVDIFDEFDYRKNLIEECLVKNGLEGVKMDAVIGRGGLMKAIPGGTYEVNEAMVSDLRNAINGQHASNLGAPLAAAIAEEMGASAYVVDPVSTDEFMDVSRVTGISDIEKASWLHALNHKAVCRQTAAEMGGSYDDYNFIVAHLGSGISTVAHQKGMMIDGSGGRSDGPFSPERSGGLPAYDLIKLCYSGKYSKEEMVAKVSKFGGFYDYLGTKDMLEIEGHVEAGDPKAKLVFDTFTYQIAKEIAMYGASLSGKVDRIIMTGGIARSKMVVEAVSERVKYLAPVTVVPGEAELEALVLGAIRVKTGLESPKQYV